MFMRRGVQLSSHTIWIFYINTDTKMPVLREDNARDTMSDKELKKIIRKIGITKADSFMTRMHKIQNWWIGIDFAKGKDYTTWDCEDAALLHLQMIPKKDIPLYGVGFIKTKTGWRTIKFKRVRR
jgi:hypothetical protein